MVNNKLGDLNDATNHVDNAQDFASEYLLLKWKTKGRKPHEGNHTPVAMRRSKKGNARRGRRPKIAVLHPPAVTEVRSPCGAAPLRIQGSQSLS
jgi:hypothetical protein